MKAPRFDYVRVLLEAILSSDSGQRQNATMAADLVPMSADLP